MLSCVCSLPPSACKSCLIYKNYYTEYSQEPVLAQEPFVSIGWVCPTCKRSLAPSVLVCPFCEPKEPTQDQKTNTSTPKDIYTSHITWGNQTSDSSTRILEVLNHDLSNIFGG